MRSYYDHLKSTAGEALQKKYHFRSSAIFPVFHSDKVKSRLLFMGYWLLKKKIKELSAIITLRSEKGLTLNRTLLMIHEPRAFVIEVGDELAKAFQEMPITFTGSLEIEFFSSVNLTFPFPAVVINYYNANFSTLVHTAQRVYNNWEDLRDNSQSQVPESGFNLYCDDQYEPFLALVNGPEKCPDFHLEMKFYNSAKKAKNETLKFGALAPYQTLFIPLDQHCNLREFFQNQVGSAKAKFSLNWIYPRLIAGNMERETGRMSITHTYYDCSHTAGPQDYWPVKSSEYAPASLIVPIELTFQHFTKLYFYPVYSPAEFAINLAIYDSNGKLKGKKEGVLKITKQTDFFQTIDLKSICEELKINAESPLAAKIMASPLSDHIPARVKLGLDLGQASFLPCNICTNLQPYNPSLDNKPESFKWGPILADQPSSRIYIMNSSPHLDYSKEASVTLNFYRKKDNETYSEEKTIPPNGFIILDPHQDEKLKNFLDKQVGWYTARTNNPYTTTYYFTENPSGSIGGDHGF